MKLRLLILITMGLCACSKEVDTIQKEADDKSTTQSLTGSERIAVSDASIEQCVAGGKVYTVFLDQNLNGVLDAEEESLSSQIVCNGADGANGLNGANGSNGVNGSDGVNGANGNNGSNGHSIQFAVVAATVDLCPAGGSVLVMALDVTDRGSYSSADPNQQSIAICNGQTGAAGAAAAYSPVDVILPCGNTVSYKEVLLRLSGGQVLAAFSENASGLNTRLSFIPDGTYMNTDGSGCVFSLATNGHERSISWQGQVQQTWPVEKLIAVSE